MWVYVLSSVIPPAVWNRREFQIKKKKETRVYDLLVRKLNPIKMTRKSSEYNVNSKK